jgi:acetyl esterase
MALDPQVQKLLDLDASLPPVQTLSVEQARSKSPPNPLLKIAKVASVSDRTIVGPGGPLCTRVYQPQGTGPFPLLISFHGGGWIGGDLDGHEPICCNLSAGAGCVVVSVAYRLAPECKFPAAVEDCRFAARWAAEHAPELNADPARMVVGGDSAGGNLAAVTALRLRDECGPRLAGQLLVYPVTDYHTPGTPSYQQNANGYGLTRAAMKWFWDHYLNNTSEALHPLVSPLRAADMSGLPPALVITAEYDPLRDEGERYAERLRQAAVPTMLLRYDGMIHGFFGLTGIVDMADVAVKDACAWLRGAFSGCDPLRGHAIRGRTDFGR